jgi:RNA polymerase sigma-70 factor (ECF subfamily)
MDRASLASLRQGDDEALEALIGRWEGPLYAFAWRYVRSEAEARDLVAETFVKLHQQRERLREDTRLSAWLFTTLANLCHNLHRWRRRHPGLSLNAPLGDTTETLADRIPDPQNTPREQAEKDEELGALCAAIEALPHDLKSTLLLHHYERLSYREIGDIMGCSERGVETRLYRAKQQLREALKTGRASIFSGFPDFPISRFPDFPTP